MLKHAWKFLVAGAVVTLGACGGDGGGGPSFADSVSTANAENAADGSAEAATYLAQNLNFGQPAIGLATAMYTRILNRPEVVAAQGRMHWVRPVAAARLDWRALVRPEGLQAAADGCTFSGHGSWDPPFGEPVDQNENGIPDDFAAEINCEESEELGGDTVVTFFSRQRVAVKEIDGSLWGMTVTFWYSEGAQDNHGNHEKIEVEQNAEIDVRTGSAATSQSMELTFSEQFGGEPYQEGFGERWNAGFDPASAIALGDPLPDGDLTLGGRRFFFETDGASVSFEISTPTALAYSAACAAVPTNPPFTAGVLRGLLNNNSNLASFDVTFTGCGAYTIDVDGAYDEPLTIAGR
jgi:hypothetical protein